MLRSSGAMADTAYHHIGKRGKYLLLLHGWNNTWESWAPLIPQLSARYQLLIPDLPGFGGSTPKTRLHGWTTATYREWLAHWLKDIGVSELAGAVGHSLGGKILGWSYLTSHNVPLPPAQHLFVIGPSGIPNKLSFTRQLLRQSLALVPRWLKRAPLLRHWRTNLYESWLGEEDYVRSNAFQEQTLHHILLEDIRQENHPDFAPAPLHIGWGEQDAAVPLWMAYEWQALFPQQSEVLVFPNAGHHAHQEQTHTAVTWITEYLQSTPTTAKKVTRAQKSGDIT